MPDEYVTIKIPQKLHEEIIKRVKESRGQFKNPQEYIQFVLTEVVKEDEEAKTAYTSEEEREIKKRLKQLGYL
jgi:Arc/MetJ-type ribon-helix-helix transcriptional regulator